MAANVIAVLLSVSVAVDSLSYGTDSITCRDIRYKDEDTSAYRFVERGSGSGAQTVSDTVNDTTTVSSTSSSATAAVAEESAGPQPRPITEQHPDLPEPVNAQPSELPCSKALQQPTLPATCEIPPVAVPQPELTRPVAEQQPELSQPATVSQPEPSRPVTVPEPALSQPIASQQPSRPVVTQEPTFSQPITSRPVPLQEPTLSQPITWQQSQAANYTEQGNVSSVLSVNSANVTGSDQHLISSTTPDLYSLSVPCLTSNQPSASTESFLPSTTSPVPPTNTQTVPLATDNTPPIPQSTWIRDLVSHPPPSFTSPTEFAAERMPARAPQVPIWSMGPLPRVPQVAGSSLPYPPNQATSTPPPGVLCRPPSKSPTPESGGFVPSQDSVAEYLRAQNKDPAENRKAVQVLEEGLSFRDFPPLQHLYGPRSNFEHSAIGPKDSSLTANSHEYKSAPFSTQGYRERDYASADNVDYGAGHAYSISGGRGAELYDHGVYALQHNVNYSLNMWPSGRPMSEFQSAAEFPSAQPVVAFPPDGRYPYMPPNPGLNTLPILYHMASGDQPLFYGSATMDYARSFSMPNSAEIPASMVPLSGYPPSALMQGNMTNSEGSHLPGDQSAVTAYASESIQHSHTGDYQYIPAALQQNDIDVVNATTARSLDDAAESLGKGETVESNTVARTFLPGNCISTLLSVGFLLCCHPC